MKLAVQLDIAKSLAAFEKLNERAKKAVRQAVWMGATLIEGTAKELIKHGSKSGVKYKDLPNRSSAPGEAPATQSNDLFESIRVETESDGLVGKVICSAEHGFWLEFGTHTEKGDVWIAPRPFMVPAFKKWAPKINDLVRKAWHAP